MSVLSQSLRNASDAPRSFANSLVIDRLLSSRCALCIVAARQCLSVRITLVRNTDSFRLS